MSDDQLTEAQKEQIRLERHVLDCRSRGLGRNATAVELNVTTYRVDQISKELGVTWGGEHVKEANRARGEQAKQERLKLGDKFRKIAGVELDSILNGMTSPAERKDMITVAGIAVDKDLKLAGATGDPEEVSGQAEAMEAMDRFIAATRAAVHGQAGNPDDH